MAAKELHFDVDARAKLKRGGTMPIAVCVRMLALISLMPVGYAIFQGVSWYQYKPTYFVMKDLDSSFLGTSSKAMRELERREKNWELSAAYLDQLVERALKEQAAATTGPNTAQLVDLAARQFAAGKLTEPQKQKLLQQTMQLALQIRERVVLGDPIPYRVNERARTPSRWWVRVAGGTVNLDGKQVRTGGGFGTMSGIGAGGNTGGSVPCTQPGEHELEVICDVQVYDGGTFGDANQRRPALQEDRKLTGRVTVLPVAPADYIKLIVTPGLTQQLQVSLAPRDFAYDKSGKGQLEGKISINNCPVNIAVEVIARYGGKEYPLNPITSVQGNSTDYVVGSTRRVDRPPPTMDIILRASQKTARQSVELFEIWDGELIFSNVPVISPLRDKPDSD